jgi:hypothetical protein
MELKIEEFGIARNIKANMTKGMYTPYTQHLKFSMHKNTIKNAMCGVLA